MKIAIKNALCYDLNEILCSKSGEGLEEFALEELWLPHPSKSSRPGWIGLWATWSGRKIWSAHGGGAGTRRSLNWLPTQINQWFYENETIGKFKNIFNRWKNRTARMYLYFHLLIAPLKYIGGVAKS